MSCRVVLCRVPSYWEDVSFGWVTKSPFRILPVNLRYYRESFFLSFFFIDINTTIHPGWEGSSSRHNNGAGWGTCICLSLSPVGIILLGQSRGNFFIIRVSLIDRVEPEPKPEPEEPRKEKKGTYTRARLFVAAIDQCSQPNPSWSRSHFLTPFFWIERLLFCSLFSRYYLLTMLLLQYYTIHMRRPAFFFSVFYSTYSLRHNLPSFPPRLSILPRSPQLIPLVPSNRPLCFTFYFIRFSRFSAILLFS